MKTYSIKKGQKSFRPRKGFLPIFNPKGFEMEFMFHYGGWSSKQEWGGDDDWNDWQKLGGLTSFFGKNNSNASMFSFRFGYEPETYEVSGYTNFPKTDFKHEAGNYERTLIVRSGVKHKAKALFHRRKVQYIIPDEIGTIDFEHPFLKRMRISREIGAYAGGSNNSKGPHGGKAFKDMKVDICIKIIK